MRRRSPPYPGHRWLMEQVAWRHLPTHRSQTQREEERDTCVYVYCIQDISCKHIIMLSMQSCMIHILNHAYLTRRCSKIFFFKKKVSQKPAFPWTDGPTRNVFFIPSSSEKLCTSCTPSSFCRLQLPIETCSWSSPDWRRDEDEGTAWSFRRFHLLVRQAYLQALPGANSRDSHACWYMHPKGRVVLLPWSCFDQVNFCTDDVYTSRVRGYTLWRRPITVGAQLSVLATSMSTAAHWSCRPRRTSFFLFFADKKRNANLGSDCAFSFSGGPQSERITNDQRRKKKTLWTVDRPIVASSLLTAFGFLTAGFCTSVHSPQHDRTRVY